MGDSMGRLEILIVTVTLSLFGVDLFFLYKSFGMEGERYLEASKSLLAINLLFVIAWLMINDR